MLKPIPRVMVFGGGALRKWLGLDEVAEGVGLHNGNRKDIGHLALLPISPSLCRLRTLRRDGYLQTGKIVLTRPAICWGLAHALAAPRTTRQKCLCFASPICGQLS